MIHTLCEKYGKQYTKEMEQKYYGATDHEICLAVVKELKLPISVDELENQLTNISSKMLPQSPLKDGAERLLRHLHDYKIPLALATNSTEQAVRLHVATKPAIFGMFHHKVGVTDPEVLRGKPHPDLYLLAASRFQEKPKPAMCLVFEDSEKGVLAAKEAGMQVVMIPDFKIDREKTRNATLVLRSLLDFKPELFGLPPFDGTQGENKPKPDGNKVTDKSEQFEEKTPKQNKKIEKNYERKSVFEDVTEIRFSDIDRLINRKSISGRTRADEQPRRLSVIDQILERNAADKTLTNKAKRNKIVSDERKTKSVPDRLSKRKVSIMEGPFGRKGVSSSERPFDNSLLGQHGKRRSILKGFERKTQGVDNKTPNSVEDQRKGAKKERQQESKKEKRAKKHW